MKRVDTWMPLMVDKYLGDTTHLTTEQHGAYLLLLMAMWKRGGSLPADEAQLAQIARMTPARWRAARPVLMAFFTLEGIHLVQKRLSIELERAQGVSKSKAAAGAKGAAKRWQKDGTAMAEPLANGSRNDAPIHTPIPIPSHSVGENTHEIGVGTSAGHLSRALREKGVMSNPMDPELIALADAGVSVELVSAAAQEARDKKGDNARIPARYVYAIARSWHEQPATRPKATYDPALAAAEALRLIEQREAAGAQVGT